MTGDDAILNAGLDLAMEWGEQWMQPIQRRLAAKFPALTAQELDAYDATCRAAMNFGHQEVYRLAEERGRDNVSRDELAAAVLARYPWIDARNLSHLFSQGMYYALKDGL